MMCIFSRQHIRTPFEWRPQLRWQLEKQFSDWRTGDFRDLRSQNVRCWIWIAITPSRDAYGSISQTRRRLNGRDMAALKPIFVCLQCLCDEKSKASLSSSCWLNYSRLCVCWCGFMTTSDRTNGRHVDLSVDAAVARSFVYYMIWMCLFTYMICFNERARGDSNTHTQHWMHYAINVRRFYGTESRFFF